MKIGFGSMTGRIVAILVAIGISSALQFGLGAPSYVSLILGAASYLAIRFGGDAHQNLSWKLGYGRGKAGRPWSEPWWVDREVYALAFMQGKGVDLPANKSDRTSSRH
jgi:hypothetical protein